MFHRTVQVIFGCYLDFVGIRVLMQVESQEAGTVCSERDLESPSKGFYQYEDAVRCDGDIIHVQQSNREVILFIMAAYGSR